MSSRYRVNDTGDSNQHRYRRANAFQPFSQTFNGSNNMVDDRGRRRGRMSNSLPPRDTAFPSYPRRRRSRDRSNDTMSARDKHMRARRDGFIGSPSYEPVIPYGAQARPGYRGRPYDPNRRRFDNNRNIVGGPPFQQQTAGDQQRRQRSKHSLTPFSERSDTQQQARGAGSPSRQRRARRSHTPLPNRKRVRLLSDSKLMRDDEDHLEYGNGDIILGRYQLLRTLGKGTFGKVAEMVDVNDRQEQKLALKIIRDVDKYRRAAEAEINFLEFIGKCKPQPGKALCVIMHSYFNYHGHMCIVFEKLGISVYDFMKRNDYHPYSMTQTRHIGYQLCHAVRFLHNNRITHTDLKPENMLFTNTDYVKDRAWAPQYEGKEIRVMSHSNIRIIDFGSAIFDQEPHTSTVTTRHYRAPEVVMKLGWSKPCDVWSIACIIFELYTGVTMFQTHEDREHLAMMEHILGRVPSRMVKRTKTEHFLPSGELDWDSQCSGARYIDEHCKSLESYFKIPFNGDPQESRQLYELLRVMFEYDQDKRVDLDHAVRHEYFNRLPREQRIPLAFGSEQPSRYNATMHALHKERNGDSGFRSLSKDNNNHNFNHHHSGNIQQRRHERIPSPSSSFRRRRSPPDDTPQPAMTIMGKRGRGDSPPPSHGVRDSHLTQRSSNYVDSNNRRNYIDDDRQRVRPSSNRMHIQQQSPAGASSQYVAEDMRFDRHNSAGGTERSRRVAPPPSVTGSAASRFSYKEQLPLQRGGRRISPRRPPDLIGAPLHVTKARTRELEQQRQHELGLRFNPPVVDLQRRRVGAVSPPPPFSSSSRSGEKHRADSQRDDIMVGASSSSLLATSETGAPLVNRYGEVIEYVGDQRRKKDLPPVEVDQPVVYRDDADKSERQQLDVDSCQKQQRTRIRVTNNVLPLRADMIFADDRGFDATQPRRSSTRRNQVTNEASQPPRRSRRNDSDPGNRRNFNNRHTTNNADNPVSGGDNVFKPPPEALTRRVQQIAAKVAEKQSGEQEQQAARVSSRRVPHRAGRRVQEKKAKLGLARQPSNGSGDEVVVDARDALHQRGRVTKRERSGHADDELADNDDSYNAEKVSSNRNYAETDDFAEDDAHRSPIVKLSSQVFIRRSPENDNDDDDDDDNEDNANKYDISDKHERYDDVDDSLIQRQNYDDSNGGVDAGDQINIIVDTSPATMEERRQRMYKRLR